MMLMVTTTGTNIPEISIRQPLDRRLGALRFFNQPNDSGKLGMSADTGGTAFEQSLLIHGRGIDLSHPAFW